MERRGSGILKPSICSLPTLGGCSHVLRAAPCAAEHHGLDVYEACRGELLHMLRSHGFSNLSVNLHRDVFCVQLSIHASWDAVALAENCNHGGSDHENAGNCGHMRHLLSRPSRCGVGSVRTRAMPGCQQQLNGQRCPFCRERVHCATRGLFMN